MRKQIDDVGYWSVRSAGGGLTIWAGGSRRAGLSPDTARDLAATLIEAADEIEGVEPPETVELEGCPCVQPQTVYITNYIGYDPFASEPD